MVVGLGNPGPNYIGTRHNFGFAVLDSMADAEGLSWKRAQWADALTCRRRDGSWLVKPTTYMNLSGRAVRQGLAWFRWEPAQILVVVDDLHLALGTLRLRPAGSSGGHNGLKSIEAELGTTRYARLRGGVGATEGADTGSSPHAGEWKGHVLGKFERNELNIMEDAVERAARIVLLAQQSGLQIAMNQANQTI